MSDPNPRPTVSGTALVWAIAAMFIAVLAAVVALSLGLPDSANPAGLAAQLLAAFSGLVASFAVLFQVGRVAKRVDEAADKVEFLSNGGGDRKAEAAVHRALDVREARQIDHERDS